MAEQALAEADAIDADAGRRRSPACRSRSRTTSPVAGQATTRGSRTYGPPAAADAEAVRRLRAAGAIPIGITNVPELTIFPWTATDANGITRNPWDLDAHAGRLVGRLGRGGRRRARAARDRAPTAAARSGSRPPAAGWSG